MQHYMEQITGSHLKVRVAKLNFMAFLPQRATQLSAGLDLASPEERHIPPRSQIRLPLGLRMKFPPGHYGRIAERSSTSWAHKLRVAAGVIDADFEGNPDTEVMLSSSYLVGEISVILYNHGSEVYKVERGAKVAQLILERYSACRVEQVSPGSFAVEENDVIGLPDRSLPWRGSNGFGSSGQSMDPN